MSGHVPGHASPPGGPKVLPPYGAAQGSRRPSRGPSGLLEDERAGLQIFDVPVTGSFEEVSWERISDRPADVILIDARPGLEHGFLDKHPIWPTLPPAMAGQVGNWYVGTMYRMPFFTEKLRELAAVIDSSRNIV
jgi:iron complex transport system substrate-binding protein